jgi:hypothetical protein
MKACTTIYQHSSLEWAIKIGSQYGPKSAKQASRLPRGCDYLLRFMKGQGSCNG